MGIFREQDPNNRQDTDKGLEVDLKYAAACTQRLVRVRGEHAQCSRSGS